MFGTSCWIRLFFAAGLCALMLVQSAHGQATTTTCFSHVYDATTATDELPLKAAVAAFKNNDCGAKLRPTGSPSALSEPNLENAVFLAFRQSEKRLDALQRKSLTPIVIPPSGPGGGIATAKIPVTLKGVGGSVVIAEVPAAAVSRDVLEKLARPAATQKQ